MCILINDIVKQYNNAYHKTIKMKPINIKDNTYITFEKEVNNKDPKLKVGDYVTYIYVIISTYM